MKFRAFLLLLSQLACVWAACTNPSVRPNWTDLTEAQKQAYLAAVLALKARTKNTVIPYNDPSKLSYDDFVQIHWDASAFAHGNDVFWPWHRLFLLRYEQALQTVDPSVIVAYWDTAAISQAPEKSEVFGSSYFGGTGISPNYCVTTGKFANWKAVVPTSHCLSRKFDGGSGKINAFYSSDATFGLLETSLYGTARKGYESGPHGRVHNGISGDMAQMYSTNDPLFFIHHSNVDRYWSIWQSCPAWAYNYDGVASTVLTPFSLKVSDVLDKQSGLNGFCYTYTTPATNLNLAKCPVSTTTTAVASTQVATTLKTVAATQTSTVDAAKYWLEVAIASLLPGGGSYMQLQRRDLVDLEPATEVNSLTAVVTPTQKESSAIISTTITTPTTTTTTTTTTSTTTTTTTTSTKDYSTTSAAEKSTTSNEDSTTSIEEDSKTSSKETTSAVETTSSESETTTAPIVEVSTNSTSIVVSSNATTTDSLGVDDEGAFSEVRGEATATTSILTTNSITNFTSTINDKTTSTYTSTATNSQNSTVPTSTAIIPLDFVKKVLTGTNVTISIPYKNSKSGLGKYAISVYDIKLPTGKYVKPKNGTVTVVPVGDRKDNKNLRHPSKAPSSWLKMNGFDETEIRQLEAKTYYMIDYINSIDTYYPVDLLKN
ncbi:hypothetical protein HK096_000965 [Nowakowskiella sp. JEL0078]|nr:hypothetical protein HK096_000965 [Nowakowskiella sp. JEL0078]